MTVGNSSIFAIILLVIGALVGAVLTFLITSLSSGKEPVSDDESMKSKRTASEKPAGVDFGEYEELVSLWRDDQNRLVVQMNGISFKTGKEMNETVQQKADALANEWFAWLGKQAPPKPRPAAVSEPEIALESRLNLPASTPVGSRPRSLLIEEENKTPDLPKESMIEQIDNILQGMISGTALANRGGIHLVETGNMGVTVWVGSQRFHGIDQVGDPEIAKVIKSAVAEWERRSTPHL